ncbi:hypothetical protein THAOC_13532, partial [Thalassiosira oceanica]
MLHVLIFLVHAFGLRAMWDALTRSLRSSKNLGSRTEREHRRSLAQMWYFMFLGGFCAILLSGHARLANPGLFDQVMRPPSYGHPEIEIIYNSGTTKNLLRANEDRVVDERQPPKFWDEIIRSCAQDWISNLKEDQVRFQGDDVVQVCMLSIDDEEPIDMMMDERPLRRHGPGVTREDIEAMILEEEDQEDQNGSSGRQGINEAGSGFASASSQSGTSSPSSENDDATMSSPQRKRSRKSSTESASPTTGFIVVETPADGSCLYHAVSRSICANTDSVITGIGVREEVANYIISNPDHRLPNGVTLTEQILRETLIEGIITPEDYARNVGTTGQHAGALE